MTHTTPNEREDWERPMGKSFQAYLKFFEACKRGDSAVYQFPEGKIYSTVALEALLTRTRQEEREKVVEFIRENGVISFEDAVLKRYVYSVSADLLEQARNLT